MITSTTSQQQQQHQPQSDSRERNLRKLRLQLLFGPGLICICGPPASGKTSLLAQLLGTSSPTPSSTSLLNNNDDSTSSHVLRATATHRRMRELSEHADALSPNPNLHPFINSLHYASPNRTSNNGSTVVAYISAASAPSAPHAIRRLGREARRCVRMWCDPPSVMSSNATGEVSTLLTALQQQQALFGTGKSSSYSATESKSLEGSVAAASLDIKAAFEEMMTTIAIKNKQHAAFSNRNTFGGGVGGSVDHHQSANSNGSSNNNNNNIIPTSMLMHQQSNTFGSENEFMEPPILHLVIDDVDLIELQQKSSKGAWGRGKSDNDIDTSALGQTAASIAAGNWDSFDQAIESLFKNVSLSNYPARGKRLWDRTKHAATVVIAPGSATFDLCTSVPALNVPSHVLSRSPSTNPSRAISMRISSGIYIWVLTQTPFESRALFERTCFFVMPTVDEIAKEAARIARASMMQSRGMKNANLFTSHALSNSNVNASDNSSSKNDGNNSRLLTRRQQQQHQKEEESTNTANMNHVSTNNSSNLNEDDTFYDEAQLEKAAQYYCRTAPTCHSIVVRDSRLLGARLVAILQYLQRTTGIGKALPKLTSIILARAWSSAASAEEQLGLARRDAEQHQNQLNTINMLQSSTAGNNNSNVMSMMDSAATTVTTTTTTTTKNNSTSSTLVASMRCLPIAAQLLAIAAFCCGALSETTLKAVLGDTTSGFLRQVRGGNGADGGRGSKTANSNFNNSHNFMTKFMFGPGTLAWAYDAVVRVATSIQESKQPRIILSATSSANNNNRNEKDDGLDSSSSDDEGNSEENKINSKKEKKKSSSGTTTVSLSLGTCCWMPGKLSNCLPSGFLAQHHVPTLEALGAVSTCKGTATLKYRCFLMPNDAASLAKQFDIDIWQLTSGASIRSA